MMMSENVIKIWIIILILGQTSECKNKILKRLRKCNNNIDIQEVEELKSHTAMEDLSSMSNNNSIKKILYYTSFIDHEDLLFGIGQNPFIEKGCPFTNCFVTNNRSLLESINQFDAILFFIGHMLGGQITLPNQYHRKSSQHYVMFLMEGPLNERFPYEKYKNFFNWTMTYRRDSDFYTPYGWIAPKHWEWHYPPVKPVNWKQYMKSDAAKVKLNPKKNLKAVWLASNCHTFSEREHYVSELQKYFPVDVYGKCGSEKCPENENCYEYLAKNYMFYLSFENSICQDYVTEKFFIPMNYDILPVVLGGANYSEIAPTKSYINTKDFSSPEELAGYLKYLVKNQVAYHEYFEWKSYFNVYNTNEDFMAKSMCHLCEKLNSETSQEKIYGNINDFWRKQDCGG